MGSLPVKPIMAKTCPDTIDWDGHGMGGVSRASCSVICANSGQKPQPPPDEIAVNPF
jgi:hypothetical protein